MEEGRSYGDALAEAQRLGFAEADPTEDVAGLDAAAKTAILATVAFGSRVPLEWVEVEGIEHVTLDHVAAARALDMHVKLIGRASARRRPRRRPRRPGVRRRPPSAGRGRGRLQRRHAAGRRDPRDHARGPRRGRDRDGLRRRRRHGLGGGNHGHRLPPERSRLAEPRAARAGRPRIALLPPARGRGQGRCARANRAGAARPGGLGGAARAAAGRRPRRAPRRHPRGHGRSGRRRRSTRSGRLPEARGEASAMPVISGRGVAELGWA